MIKKMRFSYVNLPISGNIEFIIESATNSTDIFSSVSLFQWSKSIVNYLRHGKLYLIGSPIGSGYQSTICPYSYIQRRCHNNLRQVKVFRQKMNHKFPI